MNRRNAILSSFGVLVVLRSGANGVDAEASTDSADAGSMPAASTEITEEELHDALSGMWDRAAIGNYSQIQSHAVHKILKRLNDGC